MKPVHKNNLFCYYKMVLLLVIILASMSVLSSIDIAMAVFLGLLFAGVSLFSTFLYPLDFPGGLDVKRLPTMRETQVRSLGWEDPLEKEMATHSSTLAWKIPWMEEHGRLQSIGS